MRSLTYSQLLVKDFFLIKIPKFKWGSLSFYNSTNIFSFYKKYGFLNHFFLFLDLKKISVLVNNISFNKGVCLTYFLDHYKKYIRHNEDKVPNLYIIYINKMFSFLSNFISFIENIKKFRKLTNYNTNRYPSLVFLSKKVWKNCDSFILLFIKLRIISIKSNSFLEYEKFGFYNIVIGKCYSFYLLLRSIYFLNYIKFKKW